MSGNPGEIPKFVTDMMGPSQMEEQQARPKSEITPAASGQGRPSCHPRPKSDIPRASDAPKPSPPAREADATPQFHGGRCDAMGERGSIGGRNWGPPVPAPVSKPPSEPRGHGDATGAPAKPQCAASGTRGRSSPEKSGASPKDIGSAGPRPITVNRETQRLLEEMQRQFSLPVAVTSSPPKLDAETPGTAGN